MRRFSPAALADLQLFRDRCARRCPIALKALLLAALMRVCGVPAGRFARFVTPYGHGRDRPAAGTLFGAMPASGVVALFNFRAIYHEKSVPNRFLTSA